MANWTLIMARSLTDLMVRGLHAGNALLIVLATVTAFGLLVGVADRKPPFAILPHEPILVEAGQWATLSVPVYRDLTRNCDASYARFLYDSAHSRIDLSTGFVPWEQISDYERRTPGRLMVTVPIPPLAASGVRGGVQCGSGRLASDLEYVCNKGHAYLYPIKVHTDISLDIQCSP